MLSKISHNKTLLLLFLEGFVSVSLQIFIMRQIVPFTGNSVIIMSFVIGIFLAALSAGYMAGGKHKENHLWVLNKNLLISAFIISFGFSYPVIDYFFNLFGGWFGNTFIETGAYLILFLAPVVFLLGQTIPLLTNFMKKHNVAEITGVALSINTIGSVMGSLMTSLILFYYLGVAYTLVFNVVLLGIIAFLVGSENKSIRMVNVGASIFILTIAMTLNVEYEELKFKLTTNYTNYEVVERNYNNVEMNIFKMNNSYSSAIYKSSMGINNFKYIDFIFDNMKDMNVSDQKVLVLGAGGFTLSMRDNRNNHYTYVDIDPRIREVAEKYFIKGEINGEFIAADARKFVKESKETYDVVIVDLFTNRASIPWHVTTKEFMSSLENVMNKETKVFFNIIQGTNFGDKYSRSIYNTIMSSFDYCMANQMIGDGTAMSNVIYFCQNDENNKEVYIDEYSRVEFESVN